MCSLVAEATAALLLFLPLLASSSAQSLQKDVGTGLAFPSTVTLSTRWVNTLSSSSSKKPAFSDGSEVRPLLAAFTDTSAHITSPAAFSCGFLCHSPCDTFFFSVFLTNKGIVGTVPSIHSQEPPLVVWSANRNRPVREGAVLELTREGDLVLIDSDGSLVWSSNTSRLSVSGMTITSNGNLVLFNSRNETIWQSFDHPTDTLLQGQRLLEGQSLVSGTSAFSFTEGQFHVSLHSTGLAAYIGSDPAEQYYSATMYLTMGGALRKSAIYMEFRDRSLVLVLSTSSVLSNFTIPSPSYVLHNLTIPLPGTPYANYLRLDPDGHFRLYHYRVLREDEAVRGLSKWKAVADVFDDSLDDCDYPTVCGSYGICSNAKCSCPGQGGEGAKRAYFRPINPRSASQGCAEITPLDCERSKRHQLLYLQSVAPTLVSLYLEVIDVETCKAACLSNCSCKAAFFEYRSISSVGKCYLYSRVFSLVTIPTGSIHSNSSLFIKVQSRIAGRRMAIIVAGSGAAAFVTVAILIVICVWAKMFKKKKLLIEVGEQRNIDHVLKLPVRFSREELSFATEEFSRMLGHGASGSVFEGTLADGRKVAVKRMEGRKQEDQFLAEVAAIGSLHHVNLVRLLGFCTEASSCLLVYEYMSNGSLDRWIFHENNNLSLGWQARCEVIHDVAKGLLYLHEDCLQRILHLDIKPQNILLDNNFVAKIADFGLSKLVNKDENKIVAAMRGTLGYLAPEWESSVITEKVDVYSFGVVVLEIVCGRKNLDFSQPVGDVYLLKLLKMKADANRLFDLVVSSDEEDMECHVEEAMKMIMIAIWCLHKDYKLRPTMSEVVKALEGLIEVKPPIDYSFLFHPPTIVHVGKYSPPFLESILSGPR